MTSLPTAGERTRDLVAWAGGAVIVAAGLLLWGTYWGDPTIYLVFARNIARGDLFSFNPGEFSSGSTSPLWASILALPYALGLGAAGTKAVAVVVAVAGWIALVVLVRSLQGRRAIGILAISTAAATMAVPAVLLYESGLVLVVGCAALVLGDRLVGEPTPRRVGALAALWGCMPLVRPETVLLVVLQAGVLAAAVPREDRRAIGIGAIASTVPAVVYFGASRIVCGVWSLSAAARLAATREAAPHVGSLAYSKAVPSYVLGIGALLIVAAIGFDRLLRDPRSRWLAWFGLPAVILFVVGWTFVAPLTYDVGRYLLPIAPVLAVAAARGLDALGLGRTRWVATSVAVALLGVLPWAETARGVFVQRARGLTLDVITEREATDLVNGLARPGDAVLAYEVQARYGLRDDVVLHSLDGLTDARMHEVLRTGKLGPYLATHRPRWWIVDSAVATRRHLRGGILDRARQALTTSDIAVVDGITFRVRQRRAGPILPNTNGWEMIVELDWHPVSGR